MRPEYWINHQLFKQKRGLKLVQKMIPVVQELNAFYILLTHKNISEKRRAEVWERFGKTSRLQMNLNKEQIRIQSRIKLLKRILNG